MDYCLREGMWDGYMKKKLVHMAPTASERMSLKEEKARMKRLAETMWHNA